MTVVISDDMVINTSGSGNLPPFPLTHARIGYKSICTIFNVSASSEAAGFPADAAVNPLTSEQWRPEAVPATWECIPDTAEDADYMGIAGHNLATVSAVVSVEYTINGTDWVRLREFAPVENTPLMFLFPSVTAVGWRLNIESSNGQPFIGVIYIGESLAMQRPIYGGHSPVTLSRVTDVFPVRSEAGQWIGRTIVRKGVSTEFSWNNLTAQWYRLFFDPFVKAARTTPFFIAWRPAKYPQEVGYCWTTGDIKPSNQGVRDYMSVTVPVEGLSDD